MGDEVAGGTDDGSVGGVLVGVEVFEGSLEVVEFSTRDEDVSGTLGTTETVVDGVRVSGTSVEDVDVGVTVVVVACVVVVVCV